jgi:hypothetical protein
MHQLCDCLPVLPRDDDPVWNWVYAVRTLLIVEIAVAALYFTAYYFRDGIMALLFAVTGILLMWVGVRREGFYMLLSMMYCSTVIMITIFHLVRMLMFFTSRPSASDKDYSSLAPWQQDIYKSALSIDAAVLVSLSVCSVVLHMKLARLLRGQAQYAPVGDEENPARPQTVPSAVDSGSGSGFDFRNQRGYRLTDE